MKNKELSKKEEELEQTLAKQLQLLKTDSEHWVKIGGLVLAGGLLAFAVMKVSKKKKDKSTERALLALEREGLLTKDLEKKLTESNKSSFWPSLSQRLLILGLAFAKERFLPNLFNAQPEDGNVPEDHK